MLLVLLGIVVARERQGRAMFTPLSNKDDGRMDLTAPAPASTVRRGNKGGKGTWLGGRLTPAAVSRLSGKGLTVVPFFRGRWAPACPCASFSFFLARTLCATLLHGAPQAQSV